MTVWLPSPIIIPQRGKIGRTTATGAGTAGNTMILYCESQSRLSQQAYGHSVPMGYLISCSKFKNRSELKKSTIVNISSLFGMSLGEIVGNTGGVQGSHAEEIYGVFHEAGFDGITCRVEYCDSDGAVFETDMYTLTDYEKDKNAEIQEKEESAQKTADILENYTLITSNELYPVGENTANSEYNGKSIRMENLQIILSFENTDGSMDCDMALWLYPGIGALIDMDLNDPYAVKRIREENIEYVNVYGVLNIEPNPFHPEESNISILNGGIYFLD